MNTPKRRAPYKLTTPMLAAIGAVAIIFMLLISYIISSDLYQKDQKHIVLPSQAGDAPQTDTANDNAAILQNIDISVDNVQDVIASLTRPEAYSMTVSNQILFDAAESSTLQVKQYVKNGASCMEKLNAQGQISETLLVFNNDYYAWNAGETRYYKGINGDFSGDSVAMLPTYETIIDLPKDSISDAKLTAVDGEPCIYVCTTEQNYSIAYYVSTISGLLCRAEYREGEKLVRQVKVSDLAIGQIVDSHFELPNGQSIF